jgi:hypothetical protein
MGMDGTRLTTDRMIDTTRATPLYFFLCLPGSGFSIARSDGRSNALFGGTFMGGVDGGCGVAAKWAISFTKCKFPNICLETE